MYYPYVWKVGIVRARVAIFARYSDLCNTRCGTSWFSLWQFCRRNFSKACKMQLYGVRTLLAGCLRITEAFYAYYSMQSAHHHYNTNRYTLIWSVEGPPWRTENSQQSLN